MLSQPQIIERLEDLYDLYENLYDLYENLYDLYENLYEDLYEDLCFTIKRLIQTSSVIFKGTLYSITGFNS